MSLNEQDVLPSDILAADVDDAKQGKKPQMKNLKNLIPPFTGEVASAENIEDWLLDFYDMMQNDMILHGTLWTDTVKKAVLNAFLAKEAKRWYMDQDLSVRHQSSFKEVCTMLTNKFKTKKTQMQWMKDVGARFKKKTETFHEFGAALRVFKKRSGLPEGIFVEAFCSNLGSSIQFANLAPVLMSHNFRDLDSAIAMAERITSGDGVGIGVKDRVPAAPVVVQSPVAPIGSAAAPGPVGRPVNRPGDTRQCFGCGQQGHIRRYCPKNVCRRCQQPGHIATYCRAPAPVSAARPPAVVPPPVAATTYPAGTTGFDTAM